MKRISNNKAVALWSAAVALSLAIPASAATWGSATWGGFSWGVGAIQAVPIDSLWMLIGTSVLVTLFALRGKRRGN